MEKARQKNSWIKSEKTKVMKEEIVDMISRSKEN